MAAARAMEALFSAIELIDDRAPRPAALNMALDDVLLAAAAIPTLRVYRWSAPAVSFGCCGPVAAVRQLYPGRDLVRRPTAGGIVVHGRDFTYALVAPHRAPQRASRPKPGPVAWYEAVHTRLAAALQAAGLTVEVAPDEAPAAQCFAGWSRADLLCGGRKVAGAAQRRTRHGVLLQGSAQGIAVPADFAVRWAQALAARVERRDWSAAELARAHALVESRYGSRRWTERR